MAYEQGTGVSESNFGIMELLQKLIKDRGKGVSKEEQGIMSGAKNKGKGYQSWLDKNRFDQPASTHENQHVSQFIDPNIPQYNNATTGALNTMRGLQQGGDPMLYGGGDLRAWNKDFPNDPTFTPLPPPEKFWNDGTTSYDPNMLQPLGGVSDQEMQHFQGAVSNVDTMFAQALSGLSSREQMEIISATQGYNDAQVENFKRQYLQGRVSPYELEMQSNLGF